MTSLELIVIQILSEILDFEPFSIQLLHMYYIVTDGAVNVLFGISQFLWPTYIYKYD